MHMLMLLTLLPFSIVLSVSCLQCYTDVEGSQVTTCNELEGFKTCFTKYNDSKCLFYAVVALAGMI